MSVFDMFSLKGREILLTGATGHLGSSMAWALAEAGGHVLVNSRSHAICEELVQGINKAGYSAENASFDLGENDKIIEFFKGRNGKALHCIINNAYQGGAGVVETADSNAYIQSYDISVVAAHNLLRVALPNLRRAVEMSGDASVINIASMYGMVSPDLRIYKDAASSNPPFYGAAKAALLQWTRYAACEFGCEKIRVNSISPGPFPSKNVIEEAPEFVKTLAEKVPAGRVGTPHEIQGAILLLASSASTFINGSNITIDGGWTAW